MPSTALLPVAANTEAAQAAKQKCSEPTTALDEATMFMSTSTPAVRKTVRLARGAGVELARVAKEAGRTGESSLPGDCCK